MNVLIRGSWTAVTRGQCAALGIVVSLALVVGCAGPTAAPAATQAAPANTQAAAATKPAASPATGSTAAGPAASPAAGGPAASSADWQKVLDAAKQEGSVLVYHNIFPGSEGPKVAEEFKAKTGITADFITGLGAPLSQRIRTEISGSTPSADVFEGSPQFLGPMFNEGFFATVNGKGLPTMAEPASTWKVAPTFLSDSGMLLVSRPVTQYDGHVLVNTSLISPADYPKSYHELMSDPKYKGKVGYIDPKTTGDAAAVYIKQGYVGKTLELTDFWTLYANLNPMMFPGPGDQGAATGRGEVPTSIGTSFGNLLQLAQANAPIKLLAFPNAPIVSNPSTMGVLKTAPHPNAALVFVNWFYSKEGQDFLVKQFQLPSGLRKDVASQVPASLNAEVVGGGSLGPRVVLTAAQSQLAADLNGAGVFQKLTEGISQADFESQANAFITDWESKHGGPQHDQVILKD